MPPHSASFCLLMCRVTFIHWIIILCYICCNYLLSACTLSFHFSLFFGWTKLFFIILNLLIFFFKIFFLSYCCHFCLRNHPMGWRCDSMVECLSSMDQALDWISTLQKTKKKIIP
jgi:hypothetical protein